MAYKFLTQVAKETVNPSPQLRMSLKEFQQKLAEFGMLGKNLYNAKKMSELASELEELAIHAEAYALKEDDSEDAFDNVTIRRNMGELKKYVNEFKKIAIEGDRLTQRATALYEDAGRVLGRYYEIKDVKEYVDTYGSDTIPADEQEKQVKNQPMKEGFECPCHNEPNCTCSTYCDCKNGHCECGRENTNEHIFEIQRQLRKLHLREVAYNRNKARMTPEERQAMFNKVKNDKKLIEQITIEFGEKLMKDIEDEVPYGNVVKLTTKKFNMNDDCEGFYEEMCESGFDLIAKTWGDRPPIGPNMFIEFYVPKDQFNEANSLANKIVPDYQK